MDIAKFFSNLADLPILEVCRHLDYHGLTLVSLASDKWKWAVESGKMRMESVWNVEISGETVSIYLKFEEENHNFSICFKPDGEGRIESGPNFIIYYSPSIEDTCISTLQLISYLFPPSYDHITVSLGSSDPHFPFLFLSLLPRGSARYVNIQADREVEGAHLTRFLERVTVENGREWIKSKLMVDVQMKNVVQSDKILIEKNRVEIRDARFLTQEVMRNMKFIHGKLGINNFSSEDFNHFVHNWLKEQTFMMQEAVFEIGKHQDIDLEKMFEGLDTRLGTSWQRDRYFVEFDVEDSEWRRPRVTETSAGHDIFFRNEYYGTVLITDNQLIVFQTDPHFLECYARFMGISRSHTEANLLELKTRRDEINNQIESSTDKLQYSEELKEIEEEIEEEEEELSEVSELQEKIEKWSN